MHEQPSSDRQDRAGYQTPEQEDASTEAAVLDRVIDAAPGQLTEEELIREMVGPEAEFGDRDKIERAIRGLLGYGLLHRSGRVLIPTRAAVRYSELLEV